MNASRRRVYLACAAALLLIEVVIATKLAHLGFVRSSLGDVLVTLLLYFAVLAVVDVPRAWLALGVFAFACAVEVSQYLQLARALGLKQGSVLRVMLGDSFSWGDIVCYFAGCLIALGADRALAKAR